MALRTKGRHGIPSLLDVLAGHEVTRGGHSWLEREYLRLLAAAGLPRPITQAVLARAGDRFVRVDCRFPGSAVVVELLGYRFHRTPLQMARDAERLNALVLAGLSHTSSHTARSSPRPTRSSPPRGAALVGNSTVVR